MARKFPETELNKLYLAEMQMEARCKAIQSLAVQDEVREISRDWLHLTRRHKALLDTHLRQKPGVVLTGMLRVTASLVGAIASAGGQETTQHTLHMLGLMQVRAYERLIVGLEGNEAYQGLSTSLKQMKQDLHKHLQVTACEGEANVIIRGWMGCVKLLTALTNSTVR